MILKQVIHCPDTNSVEATWTDADDQIIRCHSYADVQMQMFRDDMAIYGGNVADYEDLIAQVEAAIVPAPPPEPIIPTSCTPAQGLIALFALKSITEQDILDAINLIPDPVQRYAAQIGYSRATSWERESPTMQSMAGLLGLSEQDLDDLYVYAVGVLV